MNDTKHSRHVQRRVNKDTHKKVETPLDVKARQSFKYVIIIILQTPF